MQVGDHSSKAHVKHIPGCPNYKQSDRKARSKLSAEQLPKDKVLQINKDDSGGEWDMVDYKDTGRCNSLTENSIKVSIDMGLTKSTEQSKEAMKQTLNSSNSSTKMMTTQYSLATLSSSAGDMSKLN